MIVSKSNHAVNIGVAKSNESIPLSTNGIQEFSSIIGKKSLDTVQEEEAPSESEIALDTELLNRINARSLFLSDAALELGVHPLDISPIIPAFNPNQVLENSVLYQKLSNFQLEQTRTQLNGSAPILDSHKGQFHNVRSSLKGLRSVVSQFNESKIGQAFESQASEFKGDVSKLTDKWTQELKQLDSKLQHTFLQMTAAGDMPAADQIKTVLNSYIQSTQDPTGEMSSPNNSLKVDFAIGFGLGTESQTSSNHSFKHPSFTVMSAGQTAQRDPDLPTFSLPLKRLSLKVKDPAGVIMLEIVRDASDLHVRAIIPQEAMNDLQHLESDIRQQLKDQGLDLGSFEMYSNQDERDSSGSSTAEQFKETEQTIESTLLNGRILNRKI